MRVIGLTGGMGAGKSTLAALLAARGAAVIDVDAVGREVLLPCGAAAAAVIERFGAAVVDPDGGVDRARLAAVVFADPRALADLTAISHPAINAELDRRLVDLSQAGTAVVVLDMAVLAESNLGRDLPSGHGYDTVVVVEAPLDQRVDRLAGQRGVAAAEASARIAAQATDAQRRAVADVVITNDGDEAALADAVADLWVALGLDDYARPS